MLLLNLIDSFMTCTRIHFIKKGGILLRPSRMDLHLQLVLDGDHQRMRTGDAGIEEVETRANEVLVDYLKLEPVLS